MSTREILYITKNEIIYEIYFLVAESEETSERKVIDRPEEDEGQVADGFAEQEVDQDEAEEYEGIWTHLIF